MNSRENLDKAEDLDKPIYSIYLHQCINYISKFFRSSFVLLSFAFLLLFLAFNIPLFYPTFLGKYDGHTIVSNIFLTGFNFIVCFMLPVIISKFVLREKLSDLGLRVPENKIKAFFLTLIALIVLLPLIILVARRPEFQTYYSLKQTGFFRFAFINMIIFPLYYFTEEFFYRGFLFLGLWRRLKWHSFWITDLFFAFAHFGKPGFEILLSMFASVVFNFITLNSKSIFPAMATHWIMGATLIILINAHL